MNSANSRINTVAALSVLAMLYVSGCESSSSSGQDSLNNGLRFHMYDINSYPLNKVVCDPMGDGGGASPQRGIKAELYYRSQNQPRYYRAQDYIDHTTKSDQNLFFTNMFVPTRMFNVGFTTETSSVLKDDTGQTLIEYFGIKMNTTIRLKEADAEGTYEFALLSDDGSIMKIKNGNTWSEIINNDGDHPTRLGCSSTRIAMTRDTKLETEILYYQGPRYHISNILLWRKLSASQVAGQDSACGVTGNEHWFNPNNNSAPTANFSALLNRGWSVVNQENFFITQKGEENTQYNPCTEGSEPIISNVQITELVSSDIWVNWNTNIPSTAQLLIMNMATGDIVLTPTDNVLRTSHNMHYSGLSANTDYQLRVLNISEDLGKALSEPINFTTP